MHQNLHPRYPCWKGGGRRAAMKEMGWGRGFFERKCHYSHCYFSPNLLRNVIVCWRMEGPEDTRGPVITDAVMELHRWPEISRSLKLRCGSLHTNPLLALDDEGNGSRCRATGRQINCVVVLIPRTVDTRITAISYSQNRTKSFVQITDWHTYWLYRNERNIGWHLRMKALAEYTRTS